MASGVALVLVLFVINARVYYIHGDSETTKHSNPSSDSNSVRVKTPSTAIHQVILKTYTKNESVARDDKNVLNTKHSNPSMTGDSNPSRILYLLQTEECLPEHLRSALGNPSTCHCDVIVLSYKTICTDKSLSHVNYLFNRSTTWTTGRNLLFYTNIHNKTGRYLYYIMMDDDIQLRWPKSENPWRAFESFLTRVQPAVAGLYICSQSLSHLEKQHSGKKCLRGLDYFPTVWYDAAVTAFHYEAIEHLLPYWDHLEKISIWYSQVYLIVLGEVVFRGQVVMYKQMCAYNSKPRPYAQEGDFNRVLPMIVNVIREKIAVKCQNTPSLQQWEKNGLQYGEQSSPTYCLPPPLPKQTITPYKNFIKDC